MSRQITIEQIRDRLDAGEITATEAPGIIRALCDGVTELQAERWPIPGTEGDERYTARALLGRVVYARADKARRIRATTKHHALAWSSVGSVTGLGSGYAAALCRAYGYDADTGETLDPEGGSDD